MTIQQLNQEQIATWTRQQKDQWWLENIYRADTPQLTLRSALMGFVLGGFLAATALFIGAKTGSIVGVNIIAVILAFSFFRIVSGMGWCKDLSILENNCAQSIATSAAYMMMPLIASLTAYMLVTERVIPWWQMQIWMLVIAILGILIAFPLKRLFINEEQLPFPEGNACGIVLDALYTKENNNGIFQAKLLCMSAAFSAFFQLISSEMWMKLIQFKVLKMDQWLHMKEAWHLQEKIDSYYYTLAAYYHWGIPKILGSDFRILGLRISLEFALFGAGGLMGLRVAASILLGSLFNYAILAPIMIAQGDIVERISKTGKVIPISRNEILTQWSIWWAVSMMLVATLFSLLARPDLLSGAFQRIRKAKKHTAETIKKTDVLKHIEIPLWLSYVGIPIFSFLAAWSTHEFFAVPWHMSLIALPLTIILAIICIYSLSLTTWMPVGALAKVTQFSMGLLDRSHPANNIIPAGMSAEVCACSASLLSDIKPGYMLGAKPRQQAWGHLIGVFSALICCVPLYYLLFLPVDANGIRSTSQIVSEQFSFPAAVQWKGVADLISKGFANLAHSAVIAMLIAALVTVIFEYLKIKSKDKFPLNSMSIGLGVVLPPDVCLCMFLGAWFFSVMRNRNKDPNTKGYRIWVEAEKPIAAGLIAGAALIGIGNAILKALLAH